MSLKQELLNKINDKSAVVGVVGAGYVGLPLAVEMAEAGLTTIALDLNAEKIAMLNRGESYIEDIPQSRIAPLIQSGKLCGTTSYDDLRQADAISICVPTPLSKNRDPDMSFINQATTSIQQIAKAGMLVTLESTTYPGTTLEVMLPRLTEGGLKVGEEIFIAFSPERIDPGNKTYSVRNTPKVVGGVTPDCTEVACAFYKHAVNNLVPVSSPTTAEMSKLLENTFRAVNIGLANEVALMCDKLGIDVWEVINAASTKPFGFMPFYPGPGLGGHCIPIDPHYLSWKLKTVNYTARFIELASEINTSMPLYVVNKVTDALNEDGKAVRGSRIVVLGVAYKPDVNDVRESPAIDIIEILRQKGANVVYNDPHVPTLRFDGEAPMSHTDYSTQLLADADCVVILTNHSHYDWAEIFAHSKVVVDTRHVMQTYPADARVVTL
ncbi:nucleotide sugar dehydrogenase [Phototrophicus methaneseepsis]|uniref:Nucleotide sugar dehydrogenase n=1 Tax=Phototrophicus methaneseepsis TaxID=2710758 RepID=A0A7S8ED93_9CHLR|nr:nucleotide sugar dehydrogenase [Phototrophicus methaneseepsis]QPC84843.1 nucleotide sugar dehydrogenase [Phototrophicus methaneseepsis]